MGSATLLYRKLLIYISFFEESIKTYLKSYIKMRFIVNRNLKDPVRIKKAFRDGKMALICLNKATYGDLKSLDKIMELTYGRRGRRKHEFLRPILGTLRRGEATIPGLPRTKYPVISAEFRALIQSQNPDWLLRLESNKSNEDKMLNRKHEANIRWKSFSFIYRKIFAPLPLKEIEKLEQFSRGEKIGLTSSLFRKQRLPMPRFTDAHYITPRFRRRIYQRLLMKCPKLVYDINHGWTVEWSKEASFKNTRANLIHKDMFSYKQI
ncbi:hypothetical protein T552_00040 [Pneumocystis carinii B80]|uniref:LYR motif-containing protein Cup1-like N-terminal domain-containing protein n=1 Tax=Pneumocystis carinii (strain B80) TaxID=1408658 RepID=A0A0W4ZSP9_PNEC8|nr:hypothetical protein T552_00040 [Pneumocystis carinii B80]KTW31395.1 hypothetical protein T552_00040 [Pneumocystis carinii B80]